MRNYLSLFKISGDISAQVEKIRFLLVNLFIFFLPFDKFYTTLILYALIVTTIIDFKKSKISQIPRQFWIFQLIFFLSLSGYFYSYNKGDAAFLIERQLAILIFPLLIPLAIDITKERIKCFLTTLTISCTITVVGLFIYAFGVLFQLDVPVTNIASGEFFNHNFSDPIDIHAGYFSMYISLSIVFLLTLFPTLSSFRRGVVFLVLLVLSVGLLFLAARSILIYTAIIIFFIYPICYVKRKGVYLIICSIVAIAGLIFINNNEFLKTRFSRNLLEDINFNEKRQNIEIIEPRSDRWLLGTNLIKESPIIGHGTGDEIMMLKDKYREKGYIVSYMENYNVHNQYLSVFIKHGIIGLLIFLGALIYYFRLSIQSRNFIYFIFLVGIYFFFLTENVLDANKGIFYFSFFNTVLGYYAISVSKLVKDKQVVVI